MRRESIGWLLLDEAGQATPQSAAGIIWRSRRCIVVGDPLQIKPVVTHPEQLIKLLRQQTGVEELTWSLLVSSVQTLADRASPLGTYIGADDADNWSGFPLRVHRRCDNPMFEISNQIAYNSQMVKATKEEPFECVLGKSCWFNVMGHVVLDKHVIEEEIALLKYLLAQLTGSHTKDIYVISPFHAVKCYCEENMSSFKNVKYGTVHTFQGQEADIVFLVLGSDPAKARAREWVTESPNIINVAVTRARKRLYVIGNEALWGKLPFIKEVRKMLPVKRIKLKE